MTSKSASLLTDPQPHSHFVYPCSDENRIREAVAVFASAGLRKGDAVILVTAPELREFIEARLREDGYDTETMQRDGRLALLDAGALLKAFLGAEMPDKALFKDALGGIIQRASTDPDTGKNRRVRIFGEMVSLLYMAKNVPAAERLEEFWNELVESHSISLFCAYSLKAEAGPMPQSLLDAHSETIAWQERGQ